MLSDPWVFRISVCGSGAHGGVGVSCSVTCAFGSGLGGVGGRTASTAGGTMEISSGIKTVGNGFGLGGVGGLVPPAVGAGRFPGKTGLNNGIKPPASSIRCKPPALFEVSKSEMPEFTVLVMLSLPSSA